MDPHRRQPPAPASRIGRLYDRLAELLRKMAPERREAFQEHLDADSQEGKEPTRRTTPDRNS